MGVLFILGGCPVYSVEFCSYPNYEGKAIRFSLTLDGDILTQQGPYPLRMLGFAEQDGYVKEVYQRIE